VNYVKVVIMNCHCGNTIFDQTTIHNAVQANVRRTCFNVYRFHLTRYTHPLFFLHVAQHKLAEFIDPVDINIIYDHVHFRSVNPHQSHEIRHISFLTNI